MQTAAFLSECVWGATICHFWAQSHTKAIQNVVKKEKNNIKSCRLYFYCLIYSDFFTLKTNIDDVLLFGQVNKKKQPGHFLWVFTDIMHVNSIKRKEGGRMVYYQPDLCPLLTDHRGELSIKTLSSRCDWFISCAQYSPVVLSLKPRRGQRSSYGFNSSSQWICCLPSLCVRYRKSTLTLQVTF